MIILQLLAIYGLVFLIKETDGPFNIISRSRNILMTNKYVGVFFYKLLDCYFCSGFHAGYLIYLLSTPKSEWTINYLVLWALVGAAFSYLVNSATHHTTTS